MKKCLIFAISILLVIGNISSVLAMEDVKANNSNEITQNTEAGNQNEQVENSEEQNIPIKVDDSQNEVTNQKDANEEAKEDDLFLMQQGEVKAEDITPWDGKSKTEVVPEGNIYNIHTAEELAWVSEVTNNGTNNFAGKEIRLMNDIDLNSNNWVPIGNNNNPFKGSFDGQGYEISNLTSIANSKTHVAGLFGYVYANGYIQFSGVDFTNVNLGTTTDARVGSLIGEIHSKEEASSIYVSNINVNNFVIGGIRDTIKLYSGVIIGSYYGLDSEIKIKSCSIGMCEIKTSPSFFSDGHYIGGCIGNIEAENTTIDVNDFTAKALSIKFKTDSCGGVVGILLTAGKSNINLNDIKIEASMTASTVYAGGIVGRVQTQNNKESGSDVRLQNCYADCDLSTKRNYGYASAYAGGLISSFDESNLSIIECASVGDVTAQGYEAMASGLVVIRGKESNAPVMETLVVRNSFAIGKISAHSNGGYTYCGGLVTTNNSNESWFPGNTAGKMSIRNCYFAGTAGAWICSGGIISGANNDTVIENSYCNSANKILGAGINKAKISQSKECSIAELREKGTFNDWDFESVWAIEPGKNQGLPIHARYADTWDLKCDWTFELEEYYDNMPKLSKQSADAFLRFIYNAGKKETENLESDEGYQQLVKFISGDVEITEDNIDELRNQAMALAYYARVTTPKYVKESQQNLQYLSGILMEYVQARMEEEGITEVDAINSYSSKLCGDLTDGIFVYGTNALAEKTGHYITEAELNNIHSGLGVISDIKDLPQKIQYVSDTLVTVVAATFAPLSDELHGRYGYFNEYICKRPIYDSKDDEKFKNDMEVAVAEWTKLGLGSSALLDILEPITGVSSWGNHIDLINSWGEYICELEKWANESEHKYSLKKIAPTCIEQGYTVYICSSCGNTYQSDYVPAKGHSYVQTVIKPTCTEQGYTKHVCSVCNKTYDDNEVAALGHDYKKTVVAPSCIKDGHTTYTCKKCSHRYTGDKTKAIGHSYGKPTWDWADDGKSVHARFTCTNKGCNDSVKGYHKTIAGDVVGSKVTLAPTDDAAGKRAYTAEVVFNGVKYTDTHEFSDIPKLGKSINAAKLIEDVKGRMLHVIELDKEEKEKLQELVKNEEALNGKEVYMVNAQLFNTITWDEIHNEAVSFILEYPDGIDSSNYTGYKFVVYHIDHNGKKEIIDAKPTKEGLKITSMLSPFIIGYERISDVNDTGNVDNSNAASSNNSGNAKAHNNISTDDENMVLTWFLVLLISLLITMAILINKRRRKIK